MPHWTAAGSVSPAGSQMQEHAGVAQGVGLDPGQVEELGQAVVVGAQHLGEDVLNSGILKIRKTQFP